MSKFDVSDYVDVRERIAKFYAKYPEGSLRSEIVEYTNERVTIKAFAFRNPDDKVPADGFSTEVIPGETPFTRGSEIENAQTSAWGRALVALGFADHRPLASAQEMAGKQPEQGSEASPAPASTGAKRSPKEQEVLDALMRIPGMTHARLELLAEAVQVPKGQRASLAELRAMLGIARQPPPSALEGSNKGQF